MPETTVAELKVTRAKKLNTSNIDPDKVYEFELCTSYESHRPLERKTEKPIGSPYPPSFSLPNYGIAMFAEGAGVARKWRPRNWRYIEGQPSIWVDEQDNINEMEQKDIHQMLGQDENQLEFRDGKMRVRGIQELRLQALFCLDYYEGNEKPYKQVPPMHKFRLNNPDKQVEVSLDVRESRFKAMEQARNCTVLEMLATSLILGIDISDQTPMGLNRIKDQFLAKAEFDPSNPKGLDFFIETINKPDTKVKYIFSQGFTQGFLSSNQQPGKLTWAKMNVEILDLAGRLAPVDELAYLVITDHNEIAIEVMKKLEADIVT